MIDPDPLFLLYCVNHSYNRLLDIRLRIGNMHNFLYPSDGPFQHPVHLTIRQHT